MNINEECRPEARRALLWLAFSERPLLLKEVAEAAVVDPDTAFSPDERLPDPSYILEILGSLVTVSSEGVSNSASDYDLDCLSGREIRLAHFSVKEYLISERIRCGKASEFGATSIDANLFIAESCLSYTFHYDESNSKTMSPEDLEYFPLCNTPANFGMPTQNQYLWKV
jgi:ankyrin repeat domain-containing protein 50